MKWAWCVGMMVLSGVPAIVGGGLFWSLFESWTAVLAWEAVLLVIMAFLIWRGVREPAKETVEHIAIAH